MQRSLAALLAVSVALCGLARVACAQDVDGARCATDCSGTPTCTIAEIIASEPEFKLFNAFSAGSDAISEGIAALLASQGRADLFDQPTTTFATVNAGVLELALTTAGEGYNVDPSEVLDADLTDAEAAALIAQLVAAAYEVGESPEDLIVRPAYQIAPGIITSDMLFDGQMINTFANEPISVEVTDAGDVYLRSTLPPPPFSVVVKPDLCATDGVVHGISSMLNPPSLGGNDFPNTGLPPAPAPMPSPADSYDSSVPAGRRL